MPTYYEMGSNNTWTFPGPGETADNTSLPQVDYSQLVPPGTYTSPFGIYPGGNPTPGPLDQQIWQAQQQAEQHAEMIKKQMADYQKIVENVKMEVEPAKPKHVSRFKKILQRKKDR